MGRARPSCRSSVLADGHGEHGSSVLPQHGQQLSLAVGELEGSREQVTCDRGDVGAIVTVRQVPAGLRRAGLKMIRAGIHTSMVSQLIQHVYSRL